MTCVYGHSVWYLLGSFGGGRRNNVRIGEINISPILTCLSLSD